jgi:hypothetical protein
MHTRSWALASYMPASRLVQLGPGGIEGLAETMALAEGLNKENSWS